MWIFRKARTPRQTLSDLNAYISGLGSEPVEWLAREVRGWGEFSYDELEQIIADGRLNELIDWQSRYAAVVNETFAPMWAAAMARAAERATRGKIILSDSDPLVKDWLRTHGGELITQLSNESQRAVAAIILRAQASNSFLPLAIARQVRPLIGLTERDAQAVMNRRDKIFQTCTEGGMSIARATERAERAANRYASTKHRQRAEAIVHTELAFAYNRGAHAGVTQAIGRGLMGRCEMVWSTAGTNRVCGRCLALKGTVVGHTDESGVTLPPLHPRCRCTIMYREVEEPKPLTAPSGNFGREVKPLTPELIKEIRDAEEKAFHAKTGADFGFKRMSGSPDWAKEILLTNPPNKLYGHTPNCQRCVVAHEARMRGYDVIARPS